MAQNSIIKSLTVNNNFMFNPMSSRRRVSYESQAACVDRSNRSTDVMASKRPETRLSNFPFRLGVQTRVVSTIVDNCRSCVPSDFECQHDFTRSEFQWNVIASEQFNSLVFLSFFHSFSSIFSQLFDYFCFGFCPVRNIVEFATRELM